jgi:ERCC4-type nuclease
LILIDSRVGKPSDGPRIHDLEPLIKNHPRAVPCQVQVLDSADVVITANGPNGFVTVAFEIKALTATEYPDDFLASRASKRLDAQLARMQQTYDVRWLIIIGQWRGGKPIGNESIALEVFDEKKQKYVEKVIDGKVVTLATVENFLSGPVLHGVCRVKSFANKVDFINWLLTIYRKWQQPFPEGLAQDTEITIPLDPMWTPKFRATVQTVKGFPDIGRTYAVAATMKWGSLYGMVNASMKEWAELTTESRNGRKTRLGEKTAVRLVKWLRGENGG